VGNTHSVCRLRRADEQKDKSEEFLMQKHKEEDRKKYFYLYTQI